MNLIFKQIVEENDFEKSALIIREAFITVADDFNLTTENAPTNPAFITEEGLKKLFDKGIYLFDVYDGATQVGFVAIEEAKEELYYMEKLAVLPSYRHCGIGKNIMDFVFDFVRNRNGKKVGIAIINENTVLKQWYIHYGFAETGIKKFEHLPFTVCFLEKCV